MDSKTIRTLFFTFFKERNHTQVPSSSLIPAQDPTILFTNAGMNQFKDLFLGKQTRSYNRAVTIQKCMRAGGKHNDLSNVGFTKRHLTFFEMMGNFSFGDYFKKEAIEYAWQFLTGPMQLEATKLHATVYKQDDEAYALWRDHIGLPQERIHKLGAQDNFWQMGDTGPCGPCSEILVDRGEGTGCGKSSCAPGCSCDRFLEVWNLVFMQFDRQPDGTDIPLKRVGVDTGMGLERLCTIAQNVDSVFQTDLFAPTLKAIEERTKIKYATASPEIQAAFHVLADHIRASCFLIADGCVPTNEGRGYVLRKVIRRAALFAIKLGGASIFPALAATIVKQMGEIYPELVTARTTITQLLTAETERFANNLIQGKARLEDYIVRTKGTKTISGAEAFKLYDTYGFPLELTELIGQEHGFTVDFQGFEEHMATQRELSNKKQTAPVAIDLPDTLQTEFTGYAQLQTTAPIIGIIVNGTLQESVPAHTTCQLIMASCPFYVECGGQISDTGGITFPDGSYARLEHLHKQDGAVLVTITPPIPVAVGQKVTQQVDVAARLNTMKNHTATHLLQAALMQVLGKGVKQAGSLVAPDYLRFDFTWPETLTAAQIKQVEEIVNHKIQENIPLSINTTTYASALEQGVIAFFGDKYNPESVRVVAVPGFSAELCGGTHVRATGDIGAFKITEITALSAGQRRLVAVTGPKAVELMQETYGIVKQLAQEFKIKSEQILPTIARQKEHIKALQSELKQLRKKNIRTHMPQWLTQVEMVNSLPFLYLVLDGIESELLKELAQDLIAQRPGLYVLISNQEEGAALHIQLAPLYKGAVNMAKLGAWIREHTGLRCGGKELTLQGGGPLLAQSFEGQLKDWLYATAQ